MDFSAKNVGQLEKRKKRKTKIRARKYLQQTDGLRLVEREGECLDGAWVYGKKHTRVLCTCEMRMILATGKSVERSSSRTTINLRGLRGVVESLPK